MSISRICNIVRLASAVPYKLSSLGMHPSSLLRSFVHTPMTCRQSDGVALKIRLIICPK
jgi:hypothetical protein